MKGIRSVVVLMLLLLIAAAAFGGEQITLQKAQGDVTIRAGVMETFAKASAGDVLKPDATVRTGTKSTAVILLLSSNKKISLPPEVMLDISDIRELSQEELMLKLTMEKVRSTSYEWKNKEMNMENVPVTHGERPGQGDSLKENEIKLGILQLKGAEVLYNNGFYPTCALKAMEILRRYPPLGSNYDHRVLIPKALEKANLKSEALNAYVSLSMSENITKEQRDFLSAKIAQMKKH